MDNRKPIKLGFIESSSHLYSFEAGNWHFLSSFHLRAARHLIDSTRQLESITPTTVEQIESHRAFAITAIISIVGYLESLANEIFCACIKHKNSLHTMDEAVRDRIAATVSRSSDYLSETKPLEKYDQLLLCAGRVKMDTGRAPAQCVATVIDIRNLLAHYKPQLAPATFGTGKNKRKINIPSTVATVPWAGAIRRPNLFDQYLSHSLCEWALENTVRPTADVKDALRLPHDWPNNIRP